MSTFWTPDGERPIRKESETGHSAPPAGGRSPQESPPSSPSAAAAGAGEQGGPSPEEMAELTNQLANTPAEIVVANHAFGLFELAALHMSLNPPQLDQARTAIDALTALVEGMQGRLGEPESQLVEGLGSLRMAFVQIRAAQEGGDKSKEAGQQAGGHTEQHSGEHGSQKKDSSAGGEGETS